MRFFLSLCVLFGSYASLWVFVGPYAFFCVLGDPKGSLFIFMRPYGF